MPEGTPPPEDTPPPAPEISEYEKMLKLLEAQTYLMLVETEDGSHVNTYVSPLRVNLENLDAWVAEVRKHFPQGGVVVFNYDGTMPGKQQSLNLNPI